jgi:plasmid segregation protein ParM
MKTIGIDHGYHFCKTSEGVLFPSTIKKGRDIDLNTDTIQVTYDGTDYVVGADNGEYVADNNKINSLVTEVCTFTAIAQSFPKETTNATIDYSVVAGLPVSYYSKQKNEFRNKLISYGMKNIIVKGKSHSINICDALIYPQSAGVIFLKSKDYKNDDTLVIDVGGGTVDISSFHGLKMMNWNTYELGMLVLYSSVSQFLNSEYELKYENHEMYDLFKKGYITPKGRKINLGSINKLNDIIENHVYNVATKIKRDFNVNSMNNILIIGGGGAELFDLLKVQFENAVLCENPQFTNAEAFKFMGELKSK